MKKGFTLIELLAVIVILAIIALIATPMILNVVEKARKGAAGSSALGYIDAVEKQMMINLLDSDTTNDITDGVYETSDLEVSVKGEKPSDGWVQIGKGKVVNYSLKIGNYYVNPKDGNPSIALANKNGEIATKPEGSVIPTIASCPGCVYAYSTADWYYTENTQIGQEITTLDESSYSNNYREVVNASGRNYFLGLKLDYNNKISSAYACGILNAGQTTEKAFCIQGDTSGTYTENNQALLTSSDLYGDTCTISSSNITCDGELTAFSGSGNVSVENSSGKCAVGTSGVVKCINFN